MTSLRDAVTRDILARAEEFPGQSAERRILLEAAEKLSRLDHLHRAHRPRKRNRDYTVSMVMVLSRATGSDATSAARAILKIAEADGTLPRGGVFENRVELLAKKARRALKELPPDQDKYLAEAGRRLAIQLSEPDCQALLMKHAHRK